MNDEDESEPAKGGVEKNTFLSFSSPLSLSSLLASSLSLAPPRMAVPRAMARSLGPRIFSLPVGGKENQGGAAGAKTLFGDDENAPSTSSVPPEWALVELQGEVQPPAGAGPEESFTAGRLVLKVRQSAT